MSTQPRGVPPQSPKEASAKPFTKPPEMSEKEWQIERKQRYEEYKRKLGHSKLEVKGDPNLHYFWAPKSDDGELIRLDYEGYWFVKEPNAKEVLAGTKKPVIQAAGLREDGTYVIGDVILMACPLESYEFHMMEVEELSEAQIAASVEQFRQTAQSQGVSTFDPSARQKG